ncbi:hypothetical protein BDV06DRAFT_203431, partial [Aspergillus oleicola]
MIQGPRKERPVWQSSVVLCCLSNSLVIVPSQHDIAQMNDLEAGTMHGGSKLPLGPPHILTPDKFSLLSIPSLAGAQVGDCLFESTRDIPGLSIVL